MTLLEIIYAWDIQPCRLSGVVSHQDQAPSWIKDSILEHGAAREFSESFAALNPLVFETFGNFSGVARLRR